MDEQLTMEQVRQRLAAVKIELGTLGQALIRLGYAKIGKDLEQMGYICRMHEIATYQRPQRQRAVLRDPEED